MRSLVGLFARSPFGSLAEHAARVHEAVELLRPLFEAFIEGNWDETQKVYERISKLEHKADVLKNEIRDHLPKSLFMPVDRGDLLRFLKEQDGIADRTEDVAVLLVMRRTVTPPDMRAAVLDFVDYLIQTSAAWLSAARELTVLQEASFTGPEVEKAIQRAKDISDMEWEADKRQAALSEKLFDHEAEIGPVGVVMWMNVLRELGGVANHAENTADVLRLMLARR
ncbi:MAG TPA: TIGR00153 family protein [Longimicrobiales bacterium]|nr:TIGR00153 family protein [Longimicrobiales bacterium]